MFTAPRPSPKFPTLKFLTAFPNSRKIRWFFSRRIFARPAVAIPGDTFLNLDPPLILLGGSAR